MVARLTASSVCGTLDIAGVALWAALLALVADAAPLATLPAFVVLVSDGVTVVWALLLIAFPTFPLSAFCMFFLTGVIFCLLASNFISFRWLVLLVDDSWGDPDRAIISPLKPRQTRRLGVVDLVDGSSSTVPFPINSPTLSNLSLVLWADACASSGCVEVWLS